MEQSLTTRLDKMVIIIANLPKLPLYESGKTVFSKESAKFHPKYFLIMCKIYNGTLLFENVYNDLYNDVYNDHHIYKLLLLFTWDKFMHNQILKSRL